MVSEGSEGVHLLAVRVFISQGTLGGTHLRLFCAPPTYRARFADEKAPGVLNAVQHLLSSKEKERVTMQQLRVPWLQRRMQTICDDVPVSDASLVALFRVLEALQRGALSKRALPEPGILYSAGGDRVELSWPSVGLFIRPDDVGF
jgi:hypothetical protein